MNQGKWEIWENQINETSYFWWTGALSPGILSGATFISERNRSQDIGRFFIRFAEDNAAGMLFDEVFSDET